MAKFYVRKDEQGNVIDKKPVTRGRPPIGYIVEEDGNTNTQIVNSTPVVKQKSIYVKYDAQGNIIEKKEVTRGRPPKDFVKVNVDDNNNIITNPVETINVLDDDVVVEPIQTINEKETNSTRHVTQNLLDISSVTRPKYNSTKTIEATKHISLEDFKKYANSHSITNEENNIIKFLAVEMLNGIDTFVDFFHGGMTFSRVDVDTKTNNILVWKLHIKGEPDVIISNAIEQKIAVVA